MSANLDAPEDAFAVVEEVEVVGLVETVTWPPAGAVVVAPPVPPAAAVVPGEAGAVAVPGVTDVEFVQAVEVPATMLKGADSWVAPVLSRIVSPTEVPEGTFTSQVSEVPFCVPKFSIAGALGCPPGRRLTK